MRYLAIILFFIISTLEIVGQPIEAHSDQRFLSKPDGAPFFWMADTGWELFHRLDREEADRYLRKRKEQGFNIIQAVVLYELGPFEEPNAYGDFPLVGKDISKRDIRPGNDPSNKAQYDYWDHVKYIVEKAKEYDMIIGLLPCWGEYVTPRKMERVIAEVEQGYEYGWFIGDFLKKYNDNIVWILGGDRRPFEKPKGVEIWRAMAEGITDAVSNQSTMDGASDYSKTFMTYHCYVSSSRWFAKDEWIDMHTWGSYHEKRNNERAFLTSWAEWNIVDYKPFVNSEPAYEQLPINYDWAEVSNGRFDDYDVRQVAYWSVFSGCAGHTYGAHEVWQMYKEENPMPPLTKHNQKEWEEALDYKGATEMGYLKDLMLSVDFFSRYPDMDVVADNPSKAMQRMMACSGEGFSLVYSPIGADVSIDSSKLKFSLGSSQWFDPQTGKRSKAISQKDGELLKFNPPGEKGRDNDWVLILSSE